MPAGEGDPGGTVPMPGGAGPWPGGGCLCQGAFQ